MLNPIDVRYFKMAIGSDKIKHESSVDIQARCPICGDSKYSKSKARLHLYEKNGVTLVNCFNECSCVNKPVWKFLKDYYPSLLSNYNKECFSNKIETLKYENSENENKDNTGDTSDTGDLTDLVGDLNLDLDLTQSKSTLTQSKLIPTQTLNSNSFEKPKVLFDLSSKLEKSSKAYDYVESRGLEWYPSLGDIYISNKSFNIDGKFYNIKDFIIIPLYYKDKMYGFYSRSLKEHKFYTYIPEKNTGFKIWNLYNIDKSKTIYVFEGIFDALTAYNNGITNVIACMGAKLPLEKFKGCDLVFALDNDTTGIKNSLKYAKENYKVVIYDNDYKDLNDMFLNKININNELMNVVSGISAIIKLQRKL